MMLLSLPSNLKQKNSGKTIKKASAGVDVGEDAVLQD